MEQEAADELLGCQRHGLVSSAAIFSIVFPLEGDTLFVVREQATVGDGDAMGVAREITEYGFRPGNGPLGIHDPFTLA